VKKFDFITVTSQTKLKVLKQGFADYEAGILVSHYVEERVFLALIL